MDRVIVELLDDDYVPGEDEDPAVDLAREPVEVGVRHLMDLGMAEMDARWMVAAAKGNLIRDARPVDESAARKTI
jgi:hypothetical protein